MSIRYNGEKIAGKYKSQTIYPASENEAGIIKIASSQDVKDGTDNTKAVTPRRLKTNYSSKEELQQEIINRQNADDNLQEQIDNLKARGRFLSLWNATTGLAETNPEIDPYPYNTGDYFIVGTVGETNYKPTGTQYVIGQASTVIETEELANEDVYYFDGSVWHLQINHYKTVSFSNLAGQPSDNIALKNALDNKQNTLISGTNIKTLNNESLLGSGNIDITSAQWGNITGDITSQTDLQNALDNKQDIITDLSTIRTNAQTGADLAPQVAVNTQRIEDLTTARIPDVIYHGTPKITGGQVSNFSTINYLQFPFEDISRSLPFDIYFSFTTDDDVTTQQNIIDSHFGIALAIQNAKGIMALSSNGTNWDIGSVTGTNTILPNTTYYVKYSWTGSEYNASLSTNDQSYVPDMILQSNKSPYKTTIYIGGSEGLFGPNTAHPFKGIINFSKSKVDVNGITVWEGMADVGIASRANVSLTNLDEVGEKRFNDLQTNINTEHQERILVDGQLSDAIATKQNTILDLATIRDGASKGATALQSVPDTYATKTYVTSQGYITSSYHDNTKLDVFDIDLIEGAEQWL